MFPRRELRHASFLGYRGGDGGDGGFGGGGFGGDASADAPGDYGGWGDAGLGGLGEGSGTGAPGLGEGYGMGYGAGDAPDGFGGYGGWGDAGDLGAGLGGMDYSNEGLNYAGPTGLNASTDSPVNSAFAQTPDFLDRLKMFAKKQAMTQAISALAQTNPIAGMVANIVGPVAANPSEQTPIGQQIAGRMVDVMAAPVQAPVQGLVGLANLMGANINMPTIGQGIANANLGYKGMGPGESGFGNSTTGQTGTGGKMFDNILNAGATAYGLYNMYRAGQDARGQANSLSNMFSQNSPYAQQLRQQLERRDAAGGRRSQYGPREVELQAALAKMASGIAPNILQARQAGNQNLMQMLGMLTSANKMGVFDPVKGWLGGMFGGNSGSYTPTSTDMAGQYSGDSYGEWDLGGYGG